MKILVQQRCISNLKTTLNILQRSSYSSSSDEVLHRSKLQTYHFQNCLPRLPIPKLEDTVQRYLASVRALEGHPDINASRLKDTEASIKEFFNNEAQGIDKALRAENAKNKHTSYITKPWFDMYLSSRLPLPLNYNPYITFKKDPVEKMNDQATRSTNLIVSAMRFQKTLDSKLLTPEVFYTKDAAKSPFIQNLVRVLPNTLNLRYLPMALNGAYPLDMSQFANLFNSTRIPRLSKDELKVYPDSKHILVIRNGHFYTVNTICEDGRIMDPSTIKSSINEILNDSRKVPDNSIAYLSTSERDNWAKVREHLVNTGNESALEKIDSSIFCLVLEDSSESETITGSTEIFLHGDGASRWFDKSFSLIVAKNGDTALNFEHAWGDGVAVMRFFNEIFDDSTLKPAIQPDSTSPDSGSEVERLEFCLDSFAKHEIEQAKQQYETATSSLKAAAGKSEKINKNYLKQKKVSPDGIMQLAIQVGYYKMHGHPAATYESCSTSAFKHGRTETIRSCTIEAQSAARAIAQGSSNKKLESDSEYRSKVEDLIRKSCDKHNQLTKEAAMGQGFDRHLFGLRDAAANLLEIPEPRFFQDPCFAVMNNIVLSTSTLSSHAVNMGGFAPVVREGFGVGYGVKEDFIGCNITSYEETDVDGLVDSISSAFDDIYTVLDG